MQHSEQDTLMHARADMAGMQWMITPYMHADWAWCHTRSWHEARYITIMEEVIRTLEQRVGYRWYLDCFCTAVQPALDRRPDLIERLRPYVARGEVAVCGTFSNVRPNMVGDEAYIRNMILGRKHFQALFGDVPITVHADSVDTALGHSQIPQLIAKGGYTAYRAGRPYDTLAAKGLPHAFLWEGLDGTAVPVWWGEYGGICYETSVQKMRCEPEHWDETVALLYDEELKKLLDGSPVPVRLVAQGNDDAIPLKAFNSDADIPLPEIIQAWNEREDSSMCFATPNDFFDALAPYSSLLPRHRGAVDVCDVCYNMALGGERGLIALRLRGSERLAECEAWMAAAQALGAGRATDLTPLWEDNLTASAHATAWLFEDDFEQMRRRAERAVERADEQTETTLRAITRHMALPEHAVAVIFNSLDREREMLVPLTLPCGDIGSLRLMDGASRPVELQPLKAYEYTGKVWEHDGLALVRLPAMGYTVLEMVQGEADGRRGHSIESPGTVSFGLPNAQAEAPDGNAEISNGILRLCFRQGNLAEIWDMEQNCAVFSSRSTAWNTLRFTPVDTTADELHMGPEGEAVDLRFDSLTLLEEGPLRWRVRLTGRRQDAVYTQTISLTKGSRTIDFQLDADWPPSEGRLCCVIPTPGNGELWGGLPFGVEQKRVLDERYGPSDQARWNDLHRHYDGIFCSKDFVCARDDRHAAALCHLAGDRYYRYDHTSGDLSYLLLNGVRRSHSNWERNVNRFFEGAGMHSFAYALIVEGAEVSPESLAQAARGLRAPARVIPPLRVNPALSLPPDSQAEPSAHRAPSLPAHQSMLQIWPETVSFSAWSACEGGYLLRLVQMADQPADVRVTLSFQPQSAERQNFIGEALGGPVHCSGKSLCLSMGAFEISTVFVQAADPGAARE